MFCFREREKTMRIPILKINFDHEDKKFEYVVNSLKEALT